APWMAVRGTKCLRPRPLVLIPLQIRRSRSDANNIGPPVGIEIGHRATGRGDASVVQRMIHPAVPLRPTRVIDINAPALAAIPGDELVHAIAVQVCCQDGVALVQRVIDPPARPSALLWDPTKRAGRKTSLPPSGEN